MIHEGELLSNLTHFKGHLDVKHCESLKNPFSVGRSNENTVVTMGRKEDNIKKATEVMHILPQIRNLCIAAHIDHGKTTLSDNLIAGAGMMSNELAGAARVLDFDDQESARGITINAASASMVHRLMELIS